MAQTENQQLRNLWEKAGNDYNREQEKAVKEYERTHNHFWNIHKHKKLGDLKVKVTSLDDFKGRIARREEEFAKKRSRHHGVFDAMSSLGPAVEVIGGQAAGAGALAFPPAPMIFSAVMFLFNAGKDVSNNYDALEQLFKYCNDSISDINQLVVGRKDIPLELQNVAIHSLITVLDVMRIAAERTKHSRITDYFKAMAQPGEGGPEIAALGSLKANAKRFGTKVGIDTNVRTGRIEANMTVMATVGSDTYREVVKLSAMFTERKGDKQSSTAKPAIKDAKQRLEDKARKGLKNFLNPVLNMSDEIQGVLRTTAPGTCQWVFNVPEFKTLITEPEVPILWIYGPSGMGKTHLASSIVSFFKPSHLLGDNSITKAKVAAYFCPYIDFDSNGEVVSSEEVPGSSLEQKLDGVATSDSVDGSTQVIVGDEILDDPHAAEPTDIKIILQTLCWQLCEDDKEYERDLADHLESLQEKAGGNSSLNDIWSKLFVERKFFSTLQDRFVTLVIDGLDNLQTDERYQLYYLLRKVAQESKASGLAKVKFVILSQPTSKSEIEKLFPDFKIPHIAITEEIGRHDIETFIEWSINKSTKLSRALKDETKRISTIKKIALATKGSFEMGALLLKQLLEKDHISLFSDILENPPENITGILQHTVEHFGETHTKQDIKDLNSLLGWVSYAYAPLTLAELNAVIGIESDQGEFLDMRDKLEREFSSYFSIIDLNRRMHPPQIEDIPEDSTIGQATSQGSPQDVRREAPEEIQGEVQEDKFNQELDVGFVRFAHASIAKFFRAGKPTPVGESHKHLLIGMEKTDAHLQIARTCLRVICSTKTSSTSRDSGVTDNLLNYAANNFHKHLKEAQWAIVYEENIDIARYIIQMFRDEAVMDGWVREGEFSKLWFDPETFETSDTCGNGTLDIITTWLTGEIIQKGLNADERTWINVPSRTAGEKFLTPVALWFAKKWLQDPNSDLNYQAIYLFAMLNGLLKFFEFLAGPPGAVKPGQPYDEAVKMNADEIRRVAEWAGFEKTPLWYTRLGYNIGDIVLDDSQNDLREYKTALEMDPDFGQAHFALGGAYGDRKLYDLAIIEMNESRRCKYGGDHDQQAAVYIAEWQQARANTPEAAEEALKTLDDALEKYPDYFPAVAAYIRIAASAGRNKPAMTRLRKLGTQLPNFLRSLHAADLHRSMRQVAQQAKGVGILKKAYDIAIAKSIAIERAGGSAAFESDLPDQPTNISVQLLAAVATLYTENQEDENALKRYQTLLEIVDQNDSLFLDSRNKMAEMYFLGAYSKEATEKEQAESLQKLIQMEKDDHSKETGALSVMRPYAGLELGKFYKLRGQDEKARPFFKERVALGMSLLEDEDAYNDYQGWGILWLTFFKAGEKDDGIAAAALWCDDLKKQLKKMSGESDEPDAKDTQSPKETKERAEKPETSTTVVTRGLPAAKGTEQAPKQDSKQIRRLPRSSAPRANASTPAVQEIIDPYPDTPWNIGTSDCPCNKSLEDNKSGLWICMFCMDMSFCDDCFKLHQEGILPYILCDSEHEFARCWGYPGGLPQSMVKVGGKVRDREEWMEEIRMKWDLPSKKVEEVENTQEVNGSKASKARKFLQKLSVKP